MPCISRHHGNFFQNVTASPQRRDLAQTYGSHQSVVAPAVPVVAPLGEPPGPTPFNPLVQQQKQGRPKATTTLDNGVPRNATTLFILHENLLTRQPILDIMKMKKGVTGKRSAPEFREHELSA